ncbi:MAG: hypothetical protein AAFQ94_12695 [Bacteroidota bacterium]
MKSRNRNTKYMKFTILSTVLFLTMTTSFAQSAFDKMTNEKMSKVLLREATEVEGKLGNWQVLYQETLLLVITDENYNRMRIITPVQEVAKLKEGELKILLESNFDKALDSKYAIFDDLVWSTFTHPLNELTVEQFKDAMKQVVMLSKTFGTTYTSTDFVFGTANQSDDGN